MASFNKVILAGNLTRDPELQHLPKGTAVTKLGMAVNRTWRTESGEQKEEVTFVDVQFFGKPAETIAQHCHKGSSLLIEGRLRLDQWEDKQTNQKRSKLNVVGETFQFLGGKKDGASEPRPAGATTGKPQSPIADDDVPF